MLPFLNESVVKKVRDIKEKIDKYFTIGMGCLWTLSTLWDIIRFHCYWSDYMLELYSCFFMVFMVLYLIIPAKIPKIITDYFGLIKITLGRAIVMLVFSILFLAGSHLFHKLCSILLFIGGFILLVLELIAPSADRGETKYYPSVNNTNSDDKNNQNDSIPPTKLDDSQPEPEQLDKSGDNKITPSLDEKNYNNNNNNNPEF